MNNFWLIWLWVMWESIARNIASKWYMLWVYNRTYSKTKDFIDKNYENISGYKDLKSFIESLETPRVVFLMIKDWKPVDMMIDNIIPLLDKWDIIVDLWNSFYIDTQKRYSRLTSEWFNYMWIWVSWWELWALYGPSLMPGWNFQTYRKLEPMLKQIAARDFDWNPTVTYIWDNWAWHFVKMVHNGIEYSIMQIMAEWYDILRKAYLLKAPEIWEIFEKLSKTKLKSYLFDISVEILSRGDDLVSGDYLLDNILDIAWAKWTGLWTSVEWLNSRSLVSGIIEATTARTLSGYRDLRLELSSSYDLQRKSPSTNLDDFIEKLEHTLYAGMILAFTQGLSMIQNVAKRESWDIYVTEIVRIWQWWCIIRADLLKEIRDSYKNDTIQKNMLQLPNIQKELLDSHGNYKDVLGIAMDYNIPTPALSSLNNYFVGLLSEKTPANFIQWLRDNFWAHTYSRVDREGIYHTNWNIWNLQ